MPYNIEGYRAIIDEAERLGMPECYKDDLKIHDARIMMDHDAPQEFGWGIRDCGTDIFLPRNKAYLDMAYACKRNQTDKHYYWWSDSALREVTIDELIQKLLEAYYGDEITLTDGKIQSKYRGKVL